MAPLALLRAATAGLLTVALTLGALEGRAQSQVPPGTEATVDALAQALHLHELIGVMRLEGIAYGETIAADMFGGNAPPGWTARVSDIYDAAAMEAAVTRALAAAVEGGDVAAMVAFLGTGPGARAADLEVSARLARLDPEVEAAADDAAVLALADGDPRIDLIARYIAAGDLIERNVADAMTSNLAFYTGLLEGGAMSAGTTEAHILADVWGQGPLIRQTLTDWHYSFLYMAFAPLEDAEIEAYIAFATTPAGRHLNDALFQAFDVAFTDISRALGRAAAEFITTQDL